MCRRAHASALHAAELDGWGPWRLRTYRWCEEGEASTRVVDPPTPEVIALCENALVLADEYVPSAFTERVGRLETPLIVSDACLQVAMGMLRRGEITDSLLMAPLYPREPEAVTVWKRRRESEVE